MFKCNHNGKCCEDPTTQINLTLGDIQRISKFTKKSALDLYNEGIMGVYPFGDPFKNDEFETDIGLYIPCGFRKKNEKLGKLICSIYPARPLNCRIFPFWVLAEAPMNEVEKFVKEHPCGECCGVDEDFEEDRKLYNEYKEKLVEILSKEVPMSDSFYETLGLKKKIKTKPSKTQEEDFKIINELIKEIRKEDFTVLFKKIDEEIKKHEFVLMEDIPDWDIFLREHE